jgi:hypothetical protein
MGTALGMHVASVQEFWRLIPYVLCHQCISSFSSHPSDLPRCRCRCLQHAVLVWDLDESLILLHSLVSGSYAAACGEEAADRQELAGLARQMQRLVLQLADEQFFFQQVRPGVGGCWGASGGGRWTARWPRAVGSAC